MYYPGLFNKSVTNSYPTFNLKNGPDTNSISGATPTIPIMPSSITTTHHISNGAVYAKSLEKKSILPQSLNGSSFSPLVGSFRLPSNFCQPAASSSSSPAHPMSIYNGHHSPHVVAAQHHPQGSSTTEPHHLQQQQQHTSSLLPSYGQPPPKPPSSTPANHNLLGSHHYNSVFRAVQQHTQNNTSTHQAYGIGSLVSTAAAPTTSYATNPPNYYMNPATFNAPRYPNPVAVNNDFYRPALVNGSNYHPQTAAIIYNHHHPHSAESFGLLDYSKVPPPPSSTSLYVADTEPNSFSDHLKRLKESFQSKSSLNHRENGEEIVCIYSRIFRENNEPHNDVHNKRDHPRTLNGHASDNDSVGGHSKKSLWNPLISGGSNNNNNNNIPVNKVEEESFKRIPKNEPSDNSYSVDNNNCSSSDGRDDSHNVAANVCTTSDNEHSANNKEDTDADNNNNCKDSNTTVPIKKNSSTNRRRRFRSGLDMIRNPKKKSSKSSNNNKNKEVAAKKDSPKTSDNNKPIHIRRFTVNKSLGETLLHRSARNNRLDVVRHCLESDNCDVNARDNAGFTPLHECSSRGNLEVARLLLQHSADVNASAIGGVRPLHDAIENNHIEVVRLLLSYGADPYISTYSGTTPLQLCRSKAMTKFLESFYNDLTLEPLASSNVSYVWRLKYDPEENSGFDMFADLSSLDEPDEEEEEEEIELIFESRSQPFLNLYTLLHKPNQCPFYLLSEVIKTLKLTREAFIIKYPMITISKISQSDFNNSLIIQMEARKMMNNNNIINDNKNHQQNNKQTKTNNANINLTDCDHDELEIIYQDEQINRILQIETKRL